MKAATIIGIVVAILGLLGGGAMEGTPIGSLWNIPAFLIVIGGLTGVSIASFGIEGMKTLPKLYKKAFSAERPDLAAQVRLVVGYAERARRDGLLALEAELASVDDAFLKKGLQLVVDGADPEVVREVLEAEVEGMQARHKAGQSLFKDAGAFAPTMGIIGTVMGLISVLQKLDQPETLGPAISGAFIATLYGVGAANVIFLPVALRLKSLSESEAEGRLLFLEGILAVQAGDNPRVVGEKLLSFVPPAEREAASETKRPDLKAVPDPEAAEAA